jgi:hypothetical protein
MPLDQPFLCSTIAGKQPIAPLDGTGAPQVYIKRGVSITPLHSELGFCSAYNYMTKRSQGIAGEGIDCDARSLDRSCSSRARVMYVRALFVSSRVVWFGVNLHDLTAADRDFPAWFSAYVESGTPCLRTLLRYLSKCHVPSTVVIQTPGTAVLAPRDVQAAHFVVSIGTMIEQVTRKVEATIACVLESYRLAQHRGAHLTSGNSHLSTASMWPLPALVCSWNVPFGFVSAPRLRSGRCVWLGAGCEVTHSRHAQVDDRRIRSHAVSFVL